jgi:predicted transcriptional regulator
MERLSRAAGIALLGLTLAGPSRAVAVQMNVPAGYFQQDIGKSALADPSGVTHTKQEVAGKVVVAIFSAPTMSQGDSQKTWSNLLDEQVKPPVALVLVEDMTQAGMFKGLALDDMKKEFTPHSRPFLILDQTGDVVKKFGVPRDQTVILIYDKKGKLRDVETNLKDQDGTVQRIKAIAKQLLAA